MCNMLITDEVPVDGSQDMRPMALTGLSHLPGWGALLLLHAGNKTAPQTAPGDTTGQGWHGTVASSPQTRLKIAKFLALLVLIIQGENALLTKARLKSLFNSLNEI